jgi:hypothetical protein
MRLEVLGFRVGAPLGAACSGYAVHTASAALLLDCGPGVLERFDGEVEIVADGAVYSVG